MAEAQTATPDKIPVKDLRRCHANYDPKELLVNTALYEGGKAFEAVKSDLLRWREFEKSNLPGGTALRKARLAAAEYEPVLAGIFDYFSSATLTEPLRISVGSDATDEQRATYDALNKGLQALAQTRLINANIHKRAYIAIQFPTQPAAVPDMGAQREAGLLQPSFCAVDAPDVQDWKHDGEGNLEWARIYRTSLVQPSPFAPPTHLRHCWEFWTKTEIVEYQLDKEIVDGKPKEIEEKDEAVRIETRPHTLGAVPLVEVVLPVYVIDRLKSIAISLYNRSASMEYSLDSSAYQQGWVKTNSKDFKSMIVAESTFVRLDAGNQEEMGFTGPDTQHLVQLAADCERLDRNMYKAIQAGALRVTTSDGNTSRMSGISRMHEHGSIAVLLAAYGVALLEAFDKAVNLVKKARQEPVTLKVEVTGCDRFDLLDTEKDLAAVKDLFGFGDWFPSSARAWVMSKLLESFCYDAPQDVRQTISKELVEARNKPQPQKTEQPKPDEKKEPEKDGTAGQ